ncbi:MAG: TIGR02147 family protein [Fibrobacterota bacterium]|nr:TIGR02147 family protein [Fibrobacterota bacterium]
MKSIYEYTNYRFFLKDYYEEQKKETGFTYREFSRLTGMNSTSWLLHLIKGSKNLSADSIIRVAKALKMTKAESGYFEMMVPFTQARTNGVKDHYFQRMLGLKRKLKITEIGEELYDYYIKWYHPVIRSMVSKVDFRDGEGGHDFGLLGRCLMPAIPAREAKKSVRLLEKLDLIVAGKDGRYTQSNAVVSTGDEVASLNIVNYHKQVSRLAEGAHDLSSKEERDISALTLGISEEDFLRIKARIQAFRKEIMVLAMESKSPDRVYQLNFQLFPVGRAAKK